VHTLLNVQDPAQDAAHPATETLQVGAGGRGLSEGGPAGWRRPAAAVLVFIVGVAAGAGGLWWWRAQPTAPAFRGDEHAVELVLFEAVPPRARSSGSEARVDPLQVEGALLLSGVVTSTVLRIGTPGQSLNVRSRALPVTVSSTGRFQPVDLEIIVRDCRAASRWTPGVERPFTLAWRDEDGRMHLDRAGDFDRSLAVSLVRYIASSCANPPKG
jgi:hypothetical protein